MSRLVQVLSCFALLSNSLAAQESERYLPFGIFLGGIEEGARIFTPTRLLPPEHPEALGHDYPTTLVHDTAEYETLLLLGEHAGLKLGATLQRYPRQPEAHWPYAGYARPPVARIREARPVHAELACAPVPGLRVVAYRDRQPLAFIVDTRGMTLAERGMTRATTSGLDLSRAAFLAGLAELAGRVPAAGVQILVLARPPAHCQP